jgi:hypothetical protein
MQFKNRLLPSSGPTARRKGREREERKRSETERLPGSLTGADSVRAGE